MLGKSWAASQDCPADLLETPGNQIVRSLCLSLNLAWIVRILTERKMATQKPDLQWYHPLHDGKCALQSARIAHRGQRPKPKPDFARDGHAQSVTLRPLGPGVHFQTIALSTHDFGSHVMRGALRPAKTLVCPFVMYGLWPIQHSKSRGQKTRARQVVTASSHANKCSSPISHTRKQTLGRCQPT